MIFLLIIAVWDYSYDVGVAAKYDNNVYAYSDEYIDDFINQVNAHRFPFETYDDLITSAALNFLLRNRFFGKRTTTFSLDVAANHYLQNRDKGFAGYRLGIRQSLGKYALKLSYRIIPGYLIRYYQNPQTPTTDYIGCRATYRMVSAKLSVMKIRTVNFDVYYSRRWDDYIEEFNRYDADGHILGGAIQKALDKYLDVSISYNYRLSNADSADVAAPSNEITPDGSYYQHSFGGGLNWQTVFIFPTMFRCLYDYSYRSYTTSLEEDQFHFGRRDHRHRIMFSTQFRVLTGLHLKLSLIRQWRDATSQIYPNIDAVKDYSKYQVGAGLEFYH